jgi:3-dehydroquinate synthetase
MQSVHVNLGQRSYDILIGSGNLLDAVRFVESERDDAHAVLITDSNVETPYAEPLAAALTEAGWRRSSSTPASRASRPTWRSSCGSGCSMKAPTARRPSSPSVAA